MGIMLVDPALDARWDGFVSHHPQGTVFHLSAWARVLQERYGTPPRYYAMENGRGEITGIAPFFLVANPLGSRRLVCLPCSEYCFPLADDPEDLEKLVARGVEEAEANRASYLEIRGWSGGADPEMSALRKNPYYRHHVVPLEGTPDEFRARLGKDTRYNISRAERSSFTVREADGEGDLKRFHRLASHHRHRLQLLPWPYRYLRSIYRHLVERGHGFLLLVEARGNLVAGGLFLCHKETVIGKIDAFDRQYDAQRPNYLLIWKAIERAYERSYRRIDFGVTRPESTNLLAAKRRWGGVETSLPYYYYPDVHGVAALPATSLAYRAHTALNRMLPFFALKLTGAVFYRRLG